MSGSNWRADPRWRLISFEPRLFREPPESRPHADAERSTDHHWASLYWTPDGGGKPIIAATWVLVGLSAKEQRQMTERARQRLGIEDLMRR